MSCLKIKVQEHFVGKVYGVESSLKSAVLSLVGADRMNSYGGLASDELPYPS